MLLLDWLRLSYCNQAKVSPLELYLGLQHPYVSFIIFSFKIGIVVFSMLTNFLCDELNEDSGQGGLRQFMERFLSGDGGLFAYCSSFPHVRFFLTPPNLRLSPSWYSQARPNILRALHGFLVEKPQNLQLLDDFSGDLDPDKVHFTILAGINYVHAIADQVSALILQPPPDPTLR